MKIKILQLIEGARKAEGLTVIIDVFRAFSTACYAFANKASKIIPVGKLEKAYELKEKNKEFILVGERKGKILPGFDYGNSPAQIQGVDFSGKTIIHTTSAGTQGIVNATKASEIITGSFVNARAVASYICQKAPQVVSLVCMGIAGVEPANEDILCAYYIKEIIRDLCQIQEEIEEEIDKRIAAIYQEITAGENPGEEGIGEILRKTTGKRFFDPANKEWSPAADFQLCLQYNLYNFILRAERYNEEFYYFKNVPCNDKIAGI